MQREEVSLNEQNISKFCLFLLLFSGNAYNTLQRLFQAVGSGNINPSSSGSSTPFHSAPNDNMM